MFEAIAEMLSSQNGGLMMKNVLYSIGGFIVGLLTYSVIEYVRERIENRDKLKGLDR